MHKKKVHGGLYLTWGDMSDTTPSSSSREQATVVDNYTNVFMYHTLEDYFFLSFLRIMFYNYDLNYEFPLCKIHI